MSNECVPPYHCGTHAPGWLLGAHPEMSDGVVTRTVCFSWRNKCCRWRSQISVRNCGDFYVYRLQRAPKCKLRYCGVGKQGTTTTPGPTTNPIPTTIGKWWCYTVLFNINVYKKQLYLSVTKPNKNTSRWRFSVCLIVCFCLFLRSKRISRWGQKKITEQPKRTRSKLFIYRISSADKRECAWPIRKGATALVFYEGRAYFVDQSQREVKQNECGGGLLSTCIENCSVAAKWPSCSFFFFFRVLRTGSVIKQNKQGEKKESAYFRCAQKGFK